MDGRFGRSPEANLQEYNRRRDNCRRDHRSRSTTVVAEIQQSRWDTLVRRVTGSIGPGSRVAETLSELFPVLDVERVPAELLILGQIDICTGASQAVGAAGELGEVQLFNPAESGKIITITQVFVGTTTTQLIRWAFITTGLLNATDTERFRDLRHPINQQPTGQIRTASNPTLLQETGQIRIVGNTQAFIVDPENSVAVLPPGNGMVVAATTVATTINVSYFWRERIALEAELQF